MPAPKKPVSPKKSAKAATSRKPRTRAAAKSAPAQKPSAEEQARQYAVEAARLLQDYQCSDVVVLDVRNLSQVTDFIVIGSGTSAIQMRSVLEHVETLGKRLGFPAWRADRDDRSLWLLLDSVDVVVHLFEPNTRAHYDLEMMWGDAPRVAWERPDQARRDRAGLRE